MVEERSVTTLVGHGPEKIVIVHGWMGDHRLFDPIHALIDPQEFSVAFPDCRGYGEQAAVPGEFTVEEIAADVIALADFLGWNRFHLVGHSMAGMAAQRLLVDAPDRLASVILLSPVPAGGARLNVERRTLLSQAVAEPSMRIQLMDANTGKVRPKAWLEDLLALSLSGTTSDAMLGYIESWGGHGFEEDIGDVSTSISILIGERDPGTPEATIRERLVRLFPAAELTILPKVGHYAMIEDPTTLWRQIEKHVNRQSVTS